ncbi:hypothetical protein SAMN06265340_10947 [Desulfurobacterium atlanticum]|uniref:Uncharacterized protein n=1 Tax=Desulfurobacterium atlanticum TaxID=240169 RepID=A0A238ZLF3_9BACT|nr:hypothetical protein SAMN06265340_10947 [Desulfurobacterium atlanticum]
MKGINLEKLLGEIDFCQKFIYYFLANNYQFY